LPITHFTIEPIGACRRSPRRDDWFQRFDFSAQLELHCAPAFVRGDVFVIYRFYSMTGSLRIPTVDGPIGGSIQPPGSKSITNRALICAALADGDSVLTGALDSEDTRVMVDSLGRLGIGVDRSARNGALRVSGCGGRIPASHAELYIANSGTSVRFLTALASLGQGVYRLDGTPRMRERPIQDLIDALAQLGVEAHSESESGCPPLVVQARGLKGGLARIRGDVSSQFLSGLLLAAPYANEPVCLELIGKLVSRPYVDMTIAVMRSFGVAVEERSGNFRIPRRHYQRANYAIEPDASAASYFFAAAAITGGQITVEGLSSNSLQGDIRFCDCLAQMGCQVTYQGDQTTVAAGPLRGIEVNMNAISDTVQTLSVVALFANGPTTITGVGHIRHKETDRIGNLAIELRKLGAQVDELADGLRIIPNDLHGADIETYQDHRMAMSLALAGLRVSGVVILDPGCTDKTYPKFFDDLFALAKVSTY
jgi:3-phosphoshikimate 1-carboxyvinyltransferase